MVTIWYGLVEIRLFKGYSHPTRAKPAFAVLYCIQACNSPYQTSDSGFVVNWLVVSSCPVLAQCGLRLAQQARVIVDFTH